MRIVAGSRRGARLVAPEGLDVRPTSERTREALFSMLTSGRFGNVLVGRRVLDLFAGTGALGLEALSRGASQVVLVENHPRALEALRANVAACRARGEVQIRDQDATRFHERAAEPAGLVLMDPSYGTGDWVPALEAVAARGWIGADTVIAVEVGKTEDPDPPPGFEITDTRRYGRAKLVLLRPVISGSSPGAG